MNKIINEIIQEALTFFHNSKGSHNWEHTERVMKLAYHIGQKENADLQVIQIAAILHDIGRETQDKSHGKICHAEEGARLAKGILGKYNLTNNQKTNIIHCIESHRFRNNHQPQTIEAKILYDADKLDAIGAVGIGRAFLFAGEIGAGLHNKNVDIATTKSYSKEDTAYREYLVKLIKIKNKIMTKESIKIAKARHEFMVHFFDRLNLEVDGKI